MAKNGLKMVEFFWRDSHMIKNNILTFLVFILFVFGYFTNPEFWPNLKKIALNTRCIESTQKEKVEKPKKLKCFYLSHVRPLKIIQPFLGHFWPFLPYFT